MCEINKHVPFRKTLRVDGQHRLQSINNNHEPAEVLPSVGD